MERGPEGVSAAALARPTPSRHQMTDWARDYFERGYAQRWGLPPVTDSVRRQVSSLCQLLDVDSSSFVVDIACGHGRHALAFAERGHNVVGIDFAVALLTRARQLSADLNLPVRWIRGDMRQLPLESGIASVAVLTDSFGLFETDDENEAVLQEAARILRPAGRLVLKVLNAAPILESFRGTDREERDGTILTISRTLSHEPPQITERIRVNHDMETGEYVRRQRLYLVDELQEALKPHGFSKTSVFASPEGTPFDPAHSPAMWILAQRNAAV
jgi:ubiquinone/menaquinone biosynthesis C-methylase UbiE